ncbi:Uncharacterized conserved protein YjgD, DUF1641 family [Cohnella sp. OV330]|uniref:DUF1641 domain-containing protein n=1 Tax=Cohnella rhizosphaerae TaxID=1457232 RepID=A0A9X4KVQ9_9BACL|nr:MULTISPECIES: DUF1641 domain-containing protein [Cohnella]MDG0811593.1 DUF1641 domain-containing protein [Cohnella rhizosphaerae]SFB55429.1 Uncharacterized conserved protein YjgD, DUF1641 family [Cohnella sp. OV330]
MTTTPQTQGAEQAVDAQKAQDVLDQLMKPEVQQSLTTLVDNLPKLTEMVTTLTAAYDFASGLAKDQVFINDTKAGIVEFFTPVVDKAKGLASAAIEAGDRAEADTQAVGLFGLLKMLKDPQVQKTLRYTQAFLNVLAERQQQR